MARSRSPALPLAAVTAVVEGDQTAEQQSLIVDPGSTCYDQGFQLARRMAPERIPEVLRAR